MFKNFIITTDSACDLPMSLCMSKDIIPVRIKYNINKWTFEDTMEEFDAKAFYDRMREGDTPIVNSVSVNEYKDMWKSLLKFNLPIIHISISSSLLDTYNSAVIAKNELDANITVIDSGVSSFAEGMLVLKACEMRDNNSSVLECINWIEANKSYINGYCTTNDLSYLCRSGKVGITAKLAGKIFKNPIFKMKLNGTNILCDKTKGNKKSSMLIASKIMNDNLDYSNKTLYICHGDCEKEAMDFGKTIKDYCGFKDVEYTYIGAAMGSNMGPGLIGVFYYGNERDNLDSEVVLCIKSNKSVVSEF